MSQFKPIITKAINRQTKERLKESVTMSAGQKLMDDLKKEWQALVPNSKNLGNDAFEPGQTFIAGKPMHDWRDYIPTSIWRVWHSLSMETRYAVAITAQAQADKEEYD